MRLRPDDVLMVVDIQHDFLPGGALAVPDGDAVIAPISRLGGMFPHVLLTQDWHPADHTSFAAQHPGRRPFEIVELSYGTQVLWPTHCVQGTHGAAFSPALHLPMAELVLRKGFRRGVDSYSAFLEADRRTSTGLAGYLRERGFRRMFLGGLATDFCVAWSALDGVAAGFDIVVIEDACRAIDTNGSLAAARRDMAEAAITSITSDELG